MIFSKTEKDRLLIYVDKIFERDRKVKVEPVTHSKTISQNNYCWLVFTHIAQETGNIKEDIYHLCLAKFPVFKEIDINGSVELISVTLSGMNKDQTSNFINGFTIFFRQEGFDVPDPEDKKCLEMYQYYKDKGLL